VTSPPEWAIGTSLLLKVISVASKDVSAEAMQNEAVVTIQGVSVLAYIKNHQLHRKPNCQTAETANGHNSETSHAGKWIAY
jgi:hypothetical protein